MRFTAFLVGLGAFCGCFSGGAPLEGIALRNPDDQGPQIVWDLFATPLPRIPFPNDVGTRPDLTSPTGRRINVSAQASTYHERRVRQLANGLDGFGTYAPLWVEFEDRIDLQDLHTRHADADVSNDAIYLVNLTPGAPDYGQPVLLDFDQGRFPLLLERTDKYFRSDPRAEATNLLFESEREIDLNSNGVLDPQEDTDSDGVWDMGNLWGTVLDDPSRLDRDDDLIGFYELETDTLLLRPVLPLRPQSTYAVILTRRIVGQDNGSPIRSPFEYVHHLQQTRDLRRLVRDGVLPRLGLSTDDIAFAWTFTTQSVVQPLVDLRDGLYGEGPFAHLGDAFAPELAFVSQSEETGATPNPYIVDATRFMDALNDPQLLNTLNLPETAVTEFFDDYRSFVDYFVFAGFETPALVYDPKGAILANPETGLVDYQRETVYLTCAIPKPLPGQTPPFPMTFYGHGYGSTRLEFLGFGASMARFGIATCAIDAYGHGLLDSDIVRLIVSDIFDGENLSRVGDSVLEGRARDLNNDGFTDSGGDYWTANIFHTRDVVRQTVLDYFQAVRVVRGFGRGTMPVDADGNGSDEMSGDFNADGVPDIGADAPLYMFGISLGGIISAIVPPLEPEITVAAPISGGGGLIDIALRSVQPGVVEAAFLPLFGSLIVGRENTSIPGRIDLVFDALDVIDEVTIRFGIIEPGEFQFGDRIRVENLDNGEIDEVTLTPQNGSIPGIFRAHIPSDQYDRIELRFYREGASAPYRVINTFERIDVSLEEVGFQGRKFQTGDPLRVLGDGFGHRKGTPSLRRLVGVSQMILDAADPINFVPLFTAPQASRAQQGRPTAGLFVNTVGDMNVPINTGAAMGRAAGLYHPTAVDPNYGMSIDALLTQTHVLEGLERLNRLASDPCHHDDRNILFDIDYTSEGLDGRMAPNLTDIVRPPECSSGSPPEYCNTSCTAQPPLRINQTQPFGTMAMRFLYHTETGRHGITFPDGTRVFDFDRYQINQIGWYFATNGAEVVDDVCLEDSSCAFIPR